MDLLKLYLDPAIFGTLGLMSIVMLAYATERLLYLSRVRVDDFSDPHSLEIAITNHLTIIASIGSNAPYVGLLGTVFGIMVTFHDLGTGGTIDTSAIMLGLALALKATAGGIVVAIPAMLFYNGLMRKTDVIKAQWRSLQEQAP